MLRSGSSRRRGPGETLIDDRTQQLVHAARRGRAVDGDHMRLDRSAARGAVRQPDRPSVRWSDGSASDGGFSMRSIRPSAIARVSSSPSSALPVSGSRGSFTSSCSDVADARARRARTLSSLRRGHHLLAGVGGRPRRAPISTMARRPTENLARLASLLGGRRRLRRIVAQRLGEVVGLSERVSSIDETFARGAHLPRGARPSSRRSSSCSTTSTGARRPSSISSTRLADWSSDAPILIVCIARPELLDTRPHWGGGKLNATAIRLEPLSDAESEAAHRRSSPARAGIEGGARRRIVDAAGGNPLFVEEMLALLLEDGQ